MADPIKIQIQEKLSNGVQTYHPETDADVVLYDKTNSGLTAQNVQDAIDEVAEQISGVVGGGVVTGVKGNAETTYRKGQVNITPANIGVYTKGEIDTKVGTTLEQINAVAITANEAKSIAEGRAKAVSYDTVSAMTTALKAASNTDFKVGDNIFIKATDIPDYWISKVLTTNTGTYGFYEISVLETQKVDLSSYQTKTDNSLNTTSKTVAGAINEVRSTASTNASNITKITNGTTVVAKATNATNAANADKATQADYASELETPRKISVSGAVTGNATFDGGSDVTISTTLANSGITAGTYSAITVNAKGIATSGGQFIEIGESTSDVPSSSLAIGGLFFKRLS